MPTGVAIARADPAVAQPARGAPGPGADGVRLVRALGHDAFSEHFLMASDAQARAIEWKVLRPEYGNDPEALGRFIDEVGACQRLQHPNVVGYLGSGRLADGSYYLATEHLEGLTLAQHLRAQGVVSAEQLVTLFGHVCDGLTAVHALGLVHRGLSTQTIFLRGGLLAMTPVITGFGLAVLQGTRAFVTAPGGTPSRVASSPPECVRGHQADERSDLYALGCVLFEALTGAPPFTSGVRDTVSWRGEVRDQPVLPPSAAHLTPIVARLLANEPSDRFESAAALKAALTQFGVLPAVVRKAAFPDTKLVDAVMAGGLPDDLPGRGRLDLAQGQPGDVLGSYELLELLGEGAMGRVFRARHRALGRKVAIKLLRPEQAQQRDLIERFFQEARLVNRINHRHIVEIYDFVDEQVHGAHTSYCVMELLEGASLAQLAARGPLPLERIARVAGQVCDALEAVHALGVVHRDIKPDNLMVTQRNGADFIKVLDFGVAKLDTASSVQQVSRSLAGLIIGTPTYMSPEQIAGEDVDGRTDVYALGVVLYELLAGAPPFEAQDFIQLAQHIGTRLPPPLPELTAAGEPMPDLLSEVVVRCLEKRPSLRFQTMAALRSALELAIPPGQATAPRRHTSPDDQLVVAASDVFQEPHSGRRTWLAGAVAALVLLAAGISLARVPPGDPASAAPPEPSVGHDEGPRTLTVWSPAPAEPAADEAAPPEVAPEVRAPPRPAPRARGATSPQRVRSPDDLLDPYPP